MMNINVTNQRHQQSWIIFGYG